MTPNEITETSNRIAETLKNVYKTLKSDSKFQSLVDGLNAFYDNEGGMTHTDFNLDDDNLYHTEYGGNKSEKTYTGAIHLTDDDLGYLFIEGSCEKDVRGSIGTYFAIGRNFRRQKALYVDYKEEAKVTDKVYAYMANVLKADARKQKLNLKPSTKNVGGASHNAFLFDVSLGKAVKLSEMQQKRFEGILEKYTQE